MYINLRVAVKSLAAAVMDVYSVWKSGNLIYYDFCYIISLYPYIVSEVTNYG